MCTFGVLLELKGPIRNVKSMKAAFFINACPKVNTEMMATSE